MKKILILIIFIFTSAISFSEENYNINLEDITAKGAILIEANTGQILFEKDIHKKLYPASTTKLLTAIIISEDCDLSEIITIDKETPFTDGSKIYVREGEQFSVEQLLNALIVDSANDAAIALAKHHSGSVEEFAKVMNEKAIELGAINSNFVNPNGLHDDNHYSTAYDLSHIAITAYDNSIIREISNKARYVIPPTNKVDESRYLLTSNKFLYNESSSSLIDYRGKSIYIKYPVINGLKTGYTTKAQNCLIASGQSGDTELISVVLYTVGKAIYTDTRKMIDYGLYEFDTKTFFNKNETVTSVVLNNFKKSKISAISNKDLTIMLPKNYDESKLSTESNIRTIDLPIKKGDVIGYFIVYYDDNIIANIDLVSNISVDNSVLLNDETIYTTVEDPITTKSILLILFKFIIAFLIWRSVITLVRKKLDSIN